MTKSSSTPPRTAPLAARRTAADGQAARSAHATVRKAVTKQRARRPAGSAPPAQAGNGAGNLSPEEIRALVADAAYFRAQARGFAPGHDLDDWFSAEAEISERLARGC